jgi:pyruvate dehydrogenase E2 component (dihydrolipoamide acetyltransferase)
MNVLMPQLGETVAEGKITKWFKSVGDVIQPGDILFEIETDKTSMEVPAVEGGTLTDIHLQIGAVAPVGAVVAMISPNSTSATATAGTTASPNGAKATNNDSNLGAALSGYGATPTEGPQAPSKGSLVTPSPTHGPLDPFFEVRTPSRNYGPARLSGGTYVTPLARRLAGEKGIDLGALTGSGGRGRIVSADVMAAASSAAVQRVQLAPAESSSNIVALYQDVEFEEVPLSGMRSTIARRLVDAKQTIPHFYLSADIKVDALLKLRKQANEAAVRTGEAAYKLSVNDLIIKGLGVALQRVPAANAVWAGDRILRFKRSDIGVAVSVDDGLFTPVIRDVDRKSPSQISSEMRNLAARARAKKLLPAEYKGGVSAISNLGMYGTKQFTAIINPPHSSILAVGAVERRPTEGPHGQPIFASIMSVTLSCDHRVIDGALGAKLLEAIRDVLEDPITMVV